MVAAPPPAAPAPVPTIAAQFLRHVADCLELTGQSADPLLVRIGVSRARLDEPEALLPLSAFLDFLEDAALAARNPHFGLHAGRMVGSDSLGALSFLFLFAPTLRDAFTSFTRYLATMQQAARNQFVEGRRWATFRYGIVDPALTRRRQDAEYSIGAMWTLARTYTGGTLDLAEVRFQHDLVGDRRRYDSYFGCPVLFGQDDNALAFDRSHLDHTGKSVSPLLYPILIDHLSRKQPSAAAPGGIVAATEALIAAAPLDRPLTAARAAAALGIAPATLHRQLARQGTKWRALAEAPRMAAACRLLSETTLPVTDIALRLGYAESASFSRAFAARHGCPPGVWRRGGGGRSA